MGYTEENKFEVVCQKCKIVIQRKNIYNHERSHHRGKEFQCPKCPKSYKHKQSLEIHMENHSEIKREIPCPHLDCHKIFEKYIPLTNHLNKIHGHKIEFHSEELVCGGCAKSKKEKKDRCCKRSDKSPEDIEGAVRRRFSRKFDNMPTVNMNLVKQYKKKNCFQYELSIEMKTNSKRDQITLIKMLKPNLYKPE